MTSFRHASASAAAPAVRLTVLAPVAMRSTMAGMSCAGIVPLDLASLPIEPTVLRIEGRDGGLDAYIDRDGANPEGAADRAEALVLDFRGIDALEQTVSRARAALAAADRTIAELRVIVRVAVIAAATSDAAEDLADALDLDPATRDHAVVGSYDAVVAVLERLARHGAVDAIDVSPILADVRSDGHGDASDDHTHAVDAAQRAWTALTYEVVRRLAARGNLHAPARASAPASLGVRARRGTRAALGLPARPPKRAGARVPFATFETDIPTGF